MSKQSGDGQRDRMGRYKKGNSGAVKYRAEYANLMIEYFGKPCTHIEYAEKYDKEGNLSSKVPVVVASDLPTFEGFADSLGVTAKTLLNWCERSSVFAEAYERAKDKQKQMILVNGLNGNYNPQFAKFIAINNHGMSDKVETDGTMTFTVTLPEEIDEESN